MLVYVAIRSGQKVSWFFVALGNTFFLYRCCTGEVISLAKQRVHERKREADGWLSFC